MKKNLKNASQNQLVGMLLHKDLQKNLNKDTTESKTIFLLKTCPLKCMQHVEEIQQDARC